MTERDCGTRFTVCGCQGKLVTVCVEVTQGTGVSGWLCVKVGDYVLLDGTGYRCKWMAFC